MRQLKIALSALLLSASSLAFAASNDTSNHLITSYVQNKLTPAQVLQQLQQGNQRYRDGKSIDYNQRQLGKKTSQKGQSPYAFIFSCVDSRSVPETIFNQPVGSLFVSRIAGNVVSPDVIGSMEFATKYAGSKLVVIMGHTQCGAVAGACSKVDKPAKLGQLLDKIQPAVQQTASAAKGKLDCNNNSDVDAIAKQNVLNQMKALLSGSPTLAAMVKNGKITLIGAVHNINNGDVTFFNSDGSSV